MSRKTKEEKQRLIEQLERDIQGLHKERVKVKEQFQSLETANNDLKRKIKEATYGEIPRSAFEKNIYDGTIDIPDIKSLVDGWNIELKSLEQYLRLTKEKGKLVSVVGGFNKGKTHLLQLLSGYDCPTGFNNHTQALSFIYSQDKGKNAQKGDPIIFIDSKGSNQAVKINPSGTDTVVNSRRVAQDVRGSMSESRDLSSPISIFQSGNNIRPSHRPTDSSYAQNQARVNAIEEVRAEEDNLRLAIRDRNATEEIIQNFIMETADIIIVVVADLTYGDQKLVNKIKKKYKKDQGKKIIVVHNLYHTHSKEDVEYKKQEFIEKAFVLNQKEHAHSESDKMFSRYYYTDKSDIPHLVLAKQSTEAGNYYNPVAINYIKESIQASNNYQTIDIITKFYDYLKNNLSFYIERVPSMDREQLVEPQLDEKAFLEKYLSIKTGDKNVPIAIKLERTTKQELQLKAVSSDEFGNLQIFKSGFTPNYSVSVEEMDGRRFFCLKVECPDTRPNIQRYFKLDSNDFRIGVKGTRVASDRRIIDSTRAFEDFDLLTVPFSRHQFNIEMQSKPITQYRDGLVVLKWEMLDQPFQSSMIISSFNRNGTKY